MEKRKELLKNTIIIMIGKFCTQFLSFFLLPLYTDKLSSKEYGIIDIIPTYIVLIAPVISLQIEMGLFRYLIDNRNDKEKSKIIISSSIAHVLLQIIISIIIYILINIYIVSIPYKFYILVYTICIVLINQLLQISRGLGDNV